VNEELKLASIPGETKEAFIARCQQEAAKAGGVEDVKMKIELEKKSLPLRQRIRDQQLKVEKMQAQSTNRNIEMVAKGGEVLLSLFGGRRRSISSSVSQVRMAGDAAANLKDAKQDLENLEEQLRVLEQNYQPGAAEGVADISGLIREVPISPQQRDIYMELAGVLWEITS
jgi:hypothetical protein